MDDLISRSAVIDVLKETGIIQDNDLGHLVVDEINRIPTAYNVDKVVEQINEVLQDLNVLEIMCHLDSDSTIQNDLDNFLQAIKNEISRRLKAGGVDG